MPKEEEDVIGRSPTKKNPLNISERQKIGHARYFSVRQMFERNKWNMRDYLSHYNNLDVKPFLIALQNLEKYYTDRGVAVFKDAVSCVSSDDIINKYLIPKFMK